MKKAAIHREVAEKRLPQMLPEFLCICSIVFLFSTHTLDMNYSLLSPHCNPLTLFIFANTALFLLCHSLLSQHSEKSIMPSIQHVIDHLFTSSLVILTEEHRCIRVANECLWKTFRLKNPLFIHFNQPVLFAFVALLSNNNVCVCRLMIIWLGSSYFMKEKVLSTQYIQWSLPGE